MDDIARLLRLRNYVIAASAVTFLVWQGGWLATDILPEGTWAGLAGAATVVGGIAWAAATFMLLVYSRRVSRARAQETLNDELARHNQSRAFVAGYWVTAAVLALLLGVQGYVELETVVALRVLLIVAVVAPLTAFLWIDRDGESEGV